MRLAATSLAVVMVAAAAVAQAATPELPSDPRLAPVRPRLEAVLDKADKDGMPVELRELIVRKVREGLAKNVEPTRIESAALRLSESLTSARSFVSARRAAPGAELVRAVAEARLAGLDVEASDKLVRADRPTAEVVRAVEVLTDLGLRGYPVGRAAGVVSDVLAHEPGAVGRVPSTLETVRVEQALTHAETVDALARGLRGGGALAAAARRAAEEKPGKGGGAGGGDRPGKGNSDGFVPPGQLKKQTGAQEARGKGMGQGMGKGMGQGMGMGQGKGPTKK